MLNPNPPLYKMSKFTMVQPKVQTHNIGRKKSGVVMKPLEENDIVNDEKVNELVNALM